MRKTKLYLNVDEVEGLRLLASATGVSQAELIREGVRRLLREGISRSFHSMGKGDGPGEPRLRWNPDAVREKTLGRHQGPLTLIIDAGGLYAQADRADPAHTAVLEPFKEERGPLVTAEVIAEFYRLRSYSKNPILTLAQPNISQMPDQVGTQVP